MSDINDKKLIVDQNGETDSTKLFMSLLLSSQKWLYSYILSIVLLPSDAEDILQDTLTDMWKNFKDFTPGSNFIAWGKTIAKYKILNYRKKNKSSKLLFNDELVDLLEAESERLDNLPERLDAMKSCSRKLTEKELQFLRMRYELGLSFRRIASQYGVSKQRIYTIVSHIHSKLAKCIRQKLSTNPL